ncbi:MAG: ABC transporter permease/M1 family aminopeptidase [Planctomycetaceae bacterium]
MFRTFFSFELMFWLRGFMLYIFLLINTLIVFGAAWSDNIQIGGSLQNTHRNAPHVIQTLYAAMGLVCCLMTVAFVNSAATRDFACNTSGLIFCKPLGRLSYLMGRFWGSVSVAALPMPGVSLGVLLADLAPGNDPERWGPISWPAHVWGFLVFGLPNTIFLGAVVFALATWFRSAAVSFLGIILLLVGYSISASLLTDLDNQQLAGLLDPLGIRTFALETRYWTVAEKNTRFVTLAGPLLWNRLLWLAFGLLLLATACWRFSFSDRVSKAAGRGTEPVLSSQRSTAQRSVQCRTGTGVAFLQLFSQIRIDFFSTVKSPVFVVIVSFAMVNTLAALAFSSESFGLKSLPVTWNLVELIRGSMVLFLIAIITFFAGVLVWKERDARLDDVFDALPHPTWIMYIGKLLALTLIVAVILSLGAIAGVLTQAAMGYYRFQLSLYLTELLGLDLFRMFLQIMVAMAAHIMAPNKYLGYFLFVLIVVADTFLWIMLDVESRLVNFGSLPNYTYSDLYEFAPFVSGLLAFMVYWLLFAGMLSTAGILCWQRGRETRLRARLTEARGRWRGPIRLTSILLTAAWIITALWIRHNTQVLNTYLTASQQEDLAERYERELKGRHEPLSQPRVTDVKYEIDLVPERRSMELRGTQTLVNRSTTPQSELCLNTAIGYETTIQVERGRLRQELPDLHYQVYQLDPPLQPGESLQMTYTVKYTARGFENNVTRLDIVQNGTFFNNMICPQIGYQTERQLENRNERRKRGLGAPELMPPLEPGNLKARSLNYISTSSDWVNVETIISTSPDQIAIAPGSLLRTWEQDGRVYYHYKVDHPSLNFYSFISARYAVARDEWNGVQTEVYYHPEHSWNVPNMMRSIHKSLEYCSKNFGPYRHRQARIIEFPRVAQFAQAFPGTMPYSEAIGFIADISDEDDIDMVFYVVAHEMAHQWWAHQVMGANMQGATLLSETLAQYSSLMVMEREYGRDLMRRFLRYEMDNYLGSRGAEMLSERPLRRVEANQGYIHYNKGSVVMYHLKEVIGEDNVNAALRTLTDRFAYKEPPYPTSSDLIDALREHTPPEHAGLLVELFDQITLFDNRTHSASLKQLADDRWEVTLEVECRKFEADEEGNETEVPFEQMLEIGAFAAPDAGREYGATLAREQRLFKSGRNTVTFQTSQKPDTAGIDPFLLLIDRVPSDNTRRVQAAESPNSSL